MLAELYGWFAEGFGTADLKGKAGAARRAVLTSPVSGSLQQLHEFGLNSLHEPREFLNTLKLIGRQGASEFILDSSCLPIQGN